MYSIRVHDVCVHFFFCRVLLFFKLTFPLATERQCDRSRNDKPVYNIIKYIYIYIGTRLIKNSEWKTNSRISGIISYTIFSTRTLKWLVVRVTGQLLLLRLDERTVGNTILCPDEKINQSQIRLQTYYII